MSDVARRHARRACEAHSDLNIFAAVEAILDGGTLYTEAGQKTAQRIAALCRKERKRQLGQYDASMTAILKEKV
jgi:hypothetical protein